MSEHAPLPGILGDIEAAAGREAAIKLARARGGSRVHIPGKALDGHWLTELVGMEAAIKICWLFRNAGQGGSYVKISRGHHAIARQEIPVLLAKGWSNDRIALHLGVDLSTVQRERAKLRGTAQLSMF